MSMAEVVNAHVEVKRCQLQGGKPDLPAEPVARDVAVRGHDTGAAWLVLAFRAAPRSVGRVGVSTVLAAVSALADLGRSC